MTRAPRLTTGVVLPARSYPADDIQRDPIFLLEKRSVVITHQGSYDWCSDCEAVVEDPPIFEEDAAKVEIEPCGHVIVGDQELLDRGHAVVQWSTDRVFLTRAEAEAYGKARGYNYPGGWRTFAVSAEGALAKLLEAVTVLPAVACSVCKGVGRIPNPANGMKRVPCSACHGGSRG